MAVYQLTTPQQNIFYADLVEDTKQLFNIYGFVKIYGEVDQSLFYSAIEQLHKKFPLLNAVIKQSEELKPHFEISNNSDFFYQSIDISNHKNTSDALKNEIKKEQAYKFEILGNRLFRNSLYKLNATEYVWLFNIHHIINDGWGASVLVDSCSDIYKNLLEGKSETEPNNAFFNYHEFENKYLDSEKYQKDKVFWTDKLSSFQAIELEKGFSQRKTTISGKRYTRYLTDQLANRVNLYISENNITTHVFFMSVFYLFLAKLFNKSKISIATAVLNRPKAEYKSTIGMFLNFIPNIVELKEQNSFSDLLLAVQKEMKQNFKHQRFPIIELYQELGFKRDDLYPFLFNFQNSVHSNKFAGFNTEQEWLFNHFEEHIISININDRHNSGDYQCHFDYNNSAISENEIEIYVNRYFYMIEQVLLQNKSIAEYKLIPEAEKNELRNLLTGKSVEYSFQSLATSLDENANKNPDDIAISFGEQYITYKELSVRSNQLAEKFLIDQVEKEDRVAVILPVSIESIISLYAIFKVNAVYVPIDPEYPEDRIKYILEDSNAKHVISIKKYNTIKTTNLVDFFAENSNYESNFKPKENQESDFAYVIYTSGSTGKPKGVLVAHQQISHYVDQFNRYFNLRKNDVVAQQASIAFDTSLEEVFPILSTGGRLEIIGRETLKDPEQLVTELISKNISLFSSSPTIISELNKHKINSKNLRIIISGGDILYDNQIDYLKENYRVFNTYGPTEATICASYAEIQKGDRVHLGKAIDNCSIYLLDKNLNEVGFSTAGEIYISGYGLADSYLGKEELSDAVFIFHSKLNKRLYKTGDLARLLRTGELIYLGRKDFQVNIHGQRIELSEIDYHLTNIDGLLNATSIVIKDEKKQYIKSFIESKNISVAEVLDTLSSKLPHYMIPSSIQTLDKFPLNSNGKIDRSKLLAMSKDNEHEEEAKTKTESTLLVLISEILKEDIKDRNANIFDYGANSLNVNQIRKKIKDYFHVEILFRNIFRNPLVYKLADMIDLKLKGEETENLKLERSISPFALSRSQERIWTLEQFQETEAAYIIPIAVKIIGDLDVNRAQKSLEKIVKKHESLRTKFIKNDGILQQVISDEFVFKIKFYAKDSYQNSSEFINEKMHDTFCYEMNLEELPLFRMTVVEKEDNEFILLFAIHHIISDAWSMRIFLNDFIYFYENDKVEKKKELNYQYKDFASYQNKLLEQNSFKESEKFWLNEFNGLELSDDFPIEITRENTRSYTGKSIRKTFSKTRFLELTDFARKRNSTLYNILMAALYCFIHRYSRKDNVVIGSAVSGRTINEFDDNIGLFVNTIAIPMQINGNASFNDFFENFEEKSSNCLEHQDYPFDLLIEKLNLSTEKNKNPLFNVMLVLQNATEQFGTADGLAFSKYEVERKYTLFDLTFNFEFTQDSLELELQFNNSIYTEKTINNFLDSYFLIIDKILENNDSKINHLLALSEQESNEIIYEFNNTEVKFSENSIIKAFEEIVKNNEDKVAVKHLDYNYSYSELNKKVNQLSHYLAKQYKLTKNNIVALHMDRTDFFIISVLAVLKTGAAFLPIDRNYPKSRVLYILDDAKAKICITDNFTEFFDDSRFIDTTVLEKKIIYEESYNLQIEQAGSDLIYVLYTSGSTGKPKGVLLKHENFLNYINYAKKTYSDKLVNMPCYTNISFDFTLTSIFLPLMTSGTVHLYPDDDVQSMINQIFNDQAISICKMTPAHIDILKNIGIQATTIDKMIIGGDRLHVSQIDFLRRLNPSLIIYNEYGPTEATVGSAVKKLDPLDRSTTIGQSIANTKTLIVDKELNLLPKLAIGEICITGKGIAKSYLNRDELTNEKFIKNPYSVNEYDKTLYRTGDIGRYLNSGEIEYLGRADEQIKLRGNRVELSEIEAQLLSIDNISEAIVLALKHHNDLRLVAYVSSQKSLVLKDIRNHLYSNLPIYMVPSHFIFLESLPINQNGKVDKEKLKEINIEEHSTKSAFVESRNEIDKQLLKIWKDELKIKEISIVDDFFSLGGHSLIAIRILNKIEEIFKVKLSVNELYDYLTIEKLSDKVSLALYLEDSKKDKKQGKVLLI